MEPSPGSVVTPPEGAARPALDRRALWRDTAAGAVLALLLLAMNVASVSSHLGFIHKPKQVKEYDHHRYIDMARGLPGPHEPPYCFRLAVPFAVRGLTSLGLPLNAAFYLLTNAVLFGFLLALWLHLRDLGFSPLLRAGGLVLVGFTQGALRWFEYQYWMTDPAALFLVMLAFLLIERRKTTALAGVSLLAAFVRETYVLVYPYLFLRRLREERRTEQPLVPAAVRSLRHTLAVSALPAATLIAIRLAVTPALPDSLLGGVVEAMTFRLAHLGDNQFYVVTLGAFGVLLPLVLLLPGDLPGLVRRHFDRVLYVVCVYGTLVISNNSERPLSYALPALVPAALFVTRAFAVEARLPLAPLVAVAIALQALFWSGQRFVEMGMSLYQPVNWTTAIALVASWAVALLVRARRARTA